MDVCSDCRINHSVANMVLHQEPSLLYDLNQITSFWLVLCPQKPLIMPLLSQWTRPTMNMRISIVNV